MSDCPSTPAPMSSAGNTLLPASESCPVALFLLLHINAVCLWGCDTCYEGLCDRQPLRVFLLVVLCTTFSSTAVETHSVSCFIGATVCFSFFFFFFPLLFSLKTEERKCHFHPALLHAKSYVLQCLLKYCWQVWDGLVLVAPRWPSFFSLGLSEGSSFRCSESLQLVSMCSLHPTASALDGIVSWVTSSVLGNSPFVS